MTDEYLEHESLKINGQQPTDDQSLMLGNLSQMNHLLEQLLKVTELIEDIKNKFYRMPITTTSPFFRTMPHTAYTMNMSYKQ